MASALLFTPANNPGPDGFDFGCSTTEKLKKKAGPNAK
jgi:hypothetical protein